MKPTTKRTLLHQLLGNERFYISHHTLLRSNSISEDSFLESEDPVSNVSNLDLEVKTDIGLIRDIKNKADIIEKDAANTFKYFSNLLIWLTVFLIIFLFVLFFSCLCICKLNFLKRRQVTKKDKYIRRQNVKLETVKLQEFKSDNGITFIVEQEE